MRASTRTTLALVSAAVTSMVAIAFLIPLAVIVRDVARDRAFTTAQLAGAAIEPVLSITTDRATLERAIVSTPAGAAGQLAVYLTAATGGNPASQAAAGGGGTFVGGPQRASAADLRVAATGARAFIAPVPGGYAVLQPVALGSGRLAVTEVYVPDAVVSRGVTASWAVMTAVALALIGVSVIVADRLASRVTRPARELASAAALLGDGDLSARSTARGPAELAAAGHSFNVMADRLSSLITAERVMSADLPHRLRTPLTALRMNAAALGPGRAADDTRIAIDRLEQQVDLIIRAARRPGPDEPPRCDAAQVLTDRFAFWSALAEDQGRPCRLTGADQPVLVPVPRSDLAAATDALIGNIFKHTAEGTGFAVTLHRGEGIVLVLVADAGPGIADPGAALRRGSSSAGSTGLGLDIARRVAESTGGGLKVDTSALGGAQVQLRLRTGPPEPAGRRSRRHRLSAGEPVLKRSLTRRADRGSLVSVTREGDAITNPGTAAVTGWTLAFTLPKGTALTSLWDGSYTDDGGQVTVKSDSWDATVAPGETVTVGFVTAASGTAGQPASCTINGAPCRGATASPAPSASASSSAPSAPSPSPTPSRSATLSPSGSATPSPTGSAPAPSGSASSSPNPSAGAPSAGAAPRTSTRACSHRSASSRRPRRRA